MALSCSKKTVNIRRNNLTVIFIVWIVFIPLEQKKLESHKKVCENKYFCVVVMPSEETKILEFNQYYKSDNAPFIIYADLKCVIEKIDGCKNNHEDLYATKSWMYNRKDWWM